jgi:hypothetical protein
MLGLRLVGGGLLSAFVLLNCGGATAADSAGARATEASGGTASTDDMECAGAAGAGGCDGVGGERALEPYARLRTACGLNVHVNRRGAPICISRHIR